jgi:hypothetical protein
MSSAPVAALAPLAVAALGFVGFCWYDLSRSRSRVRYLPRWVWAVLCLVSIPLGGIVYLVLGRDGEDSRG